MSDDDSTGSGGDDNANSVGNADFLLRHAAPGRIGLVAGGGADHQGIAGQGTGNVQSPFS